MPFFHRFPPQDGNGKVLLHFSNDHVGQRPSGISSKPLRQQIRRRIQGQLHEMLQERLPSYIVPSEIRILDAVPVNKDGKRDRKVPSHLDSPL